MRIVIAVVAILINFSIYSQDAISYVQIEQSSYNEYIKGNQFKLKRIVKKAIKNNIDYYYLRMRMGITYFNKKNYLSAIPHLIKASGFNTFDTLAPEYLYICYLRTNLTNEANQTAEKLSITQKQRLHITEPKLIQEISFEYANQTNQSFEDQKNELPKLIFTPLTKVVNQSYQYFNTGMLIKVKPKISLFHAYTNLASIETARFGNPIFSENIFDVSVKQNQYYLSVGFHLNKNLRLIGGTHLIWLTTNSFSFTQGKGHIPVSMTENNQLFFAGFNLRHKHIAFTFTELFSNLNLQHQWQHSLSLHYYPFGNLNCYSETHLSLQNNQGLYHLAKQLIGVKLPFIPVWLEGYYSFGNLHNYSESTGFIIDNSNNSFISKTGIILSSSIFQNKLNVTLHYNQLIKKDNYPIDSKMNEIEFANYNLYNYSYQTLTAGIAWKF